MTEVFKIGDVVTRKDGGPKMTVSSNDIAVSKGIPVGEGEVFCQWFIDSDYREKAFAADILAKVEQR